MKRTVAVFATILIFLFSFQIYSQNSILVKSNNLLSYIDPVPGAELIRKQSSIIFRSSQALNESSVLKPGAIVISGNINGSYPFTVSRSLTSGTYIIKPLCNFSPGELITISFTDKIKLFNGVKIKNFCSSFKVSQLELSQNPLQGLENEIPDDEIQQMLKTGISSNSVNGFPQINITQSNNPSNGLILLSNIVFNVLIPNTPYLIILKNDGTPVFSRQMAGQIFNFDRQPNGNFTFFNRHGGKYYEMDSNYTVIDSFYTGNGYFTDLHELRVLPNRHALLLSYDKEAVDMSTIIPGGNPNAQVTGLILQEIDENKNVVFQWRSWDHFLITDPVHEDLLSSDIDYVHGNAIEYDYDGNILLSSRHLDEITKINRTDGSTIWRLGGKHNQFNFTNDPLRFSYQHGIRRLPNGHIIMFDNGNYHSPNFSRAVEYVLDEVNMLASVFWEYRNNPVIYGNAMGFAQRLENGNTLISWGAANPTSTEVKPDGSITLGLSFASGVFSYRVFKYDWNTNLTGINLSNNEVPEVFSLFQNYPNPFNPVTKIKFNLPSVNSMLSVNVKLAVYNLLGEKISELVNETLSPGAYEVGFDGSNLSSGIYYYKLSAGSFSDTKKMIIIK